MTDANLLLGRLDEATFLGGSVHLDRERAMTMLGAQKGSLATVEEFAAGILRVIDTEMEKAIRVISVERGHDPREFTLVAFGGGGPLHACSLARALRISCVLVPAMPGVLSAVGILLADTVRDYSRTVMLPGEAVERSGKIYAELERRGSAGICRRGSDRAGHRSMDVRYRGQGYELDVPYDDALSDAGLDAFHRLHQQRYGFCDAERPVEIVNLRLRMIAAGEPYDARNARLCREMAAPPATRSASTLRRAVLCRRDSTSRGSPAGRCDRGPAHDHRIHLCHGVAAGLLGAGGWLR